MIESNALHVTLRSVIGRSFILTYKEQPDRLDAALCAEGLHPEIIRATYSSQELTYARNTRTFMNHRDAWRRAVEHADYTLICESDFVPCARLGDLPTFWPLQSRLAWGYLYQGSPRLLALIGRKPFLRGHTAPLVAYVINSAVAKVLLRFYDDELARHQPTDYWTFDAHLQWFAMGEGAEAYIPLRHYGEHGGRPNPEHGKRGKLFRAGVHRADNLERHLLFMPDYAEGSHLKYLVERVVARALGWARLVGGRWITRTDVYPLSAGALLRMYAIGVRRLAGF
jgi:hypothetical protein